MIQQLKNAHPAINLKTAYEYARSVSKKLSTDVAFDRRSLLRAMGFERVTGSTQNAAGSLVHFGLLKRVEGGYILPKATREIFAAKEGTEEWKTRVKPMATNPELYRYLFDSFKLNLPPDIESILIKKYGDRNVNKQNVSVVLKNYLDSLAFAGYPTAGRLQTPKNEPKINAAERKIVDLDGRTIEITKKYLLEAYEKTLRDELEQVQLRLRSLK